MTQTGKWDDDGRGERSRENSGACTSLPHQLAVCAASCQPKLKTRALLLLLLLLLLPPEQCRLFAPDTSTACSSH